MSVKYKELQDFTRKIENLNKQQKDEFMKACCKELAARLLEKVIKRTKPGNYSKEIEVTAKRDSKYHKKGDKYKKKVTPKKGGTLRRGWTAETHEEAVNGNGNGKKPEEYANSMKIDAKIFKESHYVIDTHTAVAAGVYDKYTADTKLHLRRKKEKNIVRNIWTEEEYQKTFDGKYFP